MGRPGEKDSDAIHRSVPNELAGMTEKVAPAVGDLVYIESLADGGAARKAEAGNLPGGGGGGGGLIGFGPFRFEADQFENPNDLGDFPAFTTLAPAEADDLNDGITVRSFPKDGANHPRVGFTVFVPVGAVSLQFRLRSRARVGPVAPDTLVGCFFDYRGIPDMAAVEAWHGSVGVSNMGFPITTTFFQYNSFSPITLAFLSITAGRLYQFNWARDIGTGLDLDDDWLLKELEIEFFDS